MVAMSACGSPLSSNRRIEPAVAEKSSVRPGSASLCLVVESGGSRCCSAAADDAAQGETFREGIKEEQVLKDQDLLQRT